MTSTEFFAHRFRVASFRTGFLLGVFSLAFFLPAMPLSADTIDWLGNDGTDPTFWDIGTTTNWTGDAGGRNDNLYQDGDDVTFDDSASTFTVDLQTTVSPGSMAISAGSNNYTFNSGDIAGATSVAKTGNAAAEFTQNSLSFTGGTTIGGSGDITFAPGAAGPHNFGTGPIALNNSGAEFIYNPTVGGSELTNDFTINANVIWDRAQNSGTRSGTATINNDFRLRSDGTSGGIMEADMLLTGDREILAGRFGSLATIPQITGDVSSSGGPHTLTLRHQGQNPDWRIIIGDNTSTAPNWDVANLIRTSNAPVTQRAGTLEFTVDERVFFDNIETNGGRVVLEGGIRFNRSNTVEVEFDMIVNENNATNNTGAVFIGTGFADNDALNIRSGGLLGGDGTMRHRNGLGATPYEDPVDVNVFSGGEISPGDATLADTTDVLTIQGDLTFSGGTLRIDITGGGETPGVDFDQLVVENSVSSSDRGDVTGLNTATLLVDFSGVAVSDLEGDVITILTSANDLSGESFAAVQSFGGISFDVTFGNGFIQLLNFQVPEPNSLALLLGGMALIVRKRRRRRNR